MATENDDVIISVSTMDSQEEEYKQKYEYVQPILNTLIKLNNVPFSVVNILILLISITRLQTIETIL